MIPSWAFAVLHADDELGLAAPPETSHIASHGPPDRSDPPLTGDEAEELAASLEDVASPEEIERRQQTAREFFSAVTRPKTLRPHRDEGQP